MKSVPSVQSLRFLRNLLQPHSSPFQSHACRPFLHSVRSRRPFHSTPHRERIETHTLSDIGEGVKEVQVIQWFVEEGAQIEEWGPLCEVQSDKASVEITSKFSGVIKKIHAARDAVVQVGEGMVDIEVEGDEEPPEESQETGEEEHDVEVEVEPEQKQPVTEAPKSEQIKPVERGKHASLATPAVRGLLKEYDLNINDINGTGKDGRVLKEDIFKHLDSPPSTPAMSSPAAHKPSLSTKQSETPQKLTPIQSAMFKSMSASLSIPHFLYTDSVDITSLVALRKRLNAARSPDEPKFSYLPFIVKAVSLAMNQYPILNARLDTKSDERKPQLIMRASHNIGIAMDTPAGLLVPVVKNVNARSIRDIAVEVARLGELGQAGKLANEDLSGGTITVSNIGNIGGGVLAPVIVEGQLAIMAVGKLRSVPVFDERGNVVKSEQFQMSWSADHRVVDGATMARAADVVRRYLEETGTMVVDIS